MATVENCSLADRMDRVYEKDDWYLYGYARLMIPNSRAMIAIMRRM